MLESFGARLRQRREQQHIALITIAEQTKIKLSLLEALERDDVSHWPSGIFRRAFVRAYAHAIGLNPDVVVREFLERYPDPIEVVAAEPLSLSEPDDIRGPGGPPTRFHYLVGSAIGSLARLRRSPAVQDRAAANHVPVTAPLPSEPDVAAAAQPSTESCRVDGTEDVSPDYALVNEQARFEPDLTSVAHPVSEPHREDVTDDVGANCVPVNGPPSAELDFMEVAHLCTEFGRVQSATEMPPLMATAAGILDAIGLIVWVWDGLAAELRPALAHGYSDKVLAQLPAVSRDDDNATAAAFRSAQTCAIMGSDHASGALVVPLLTARGCAGVLAIELQHGHEPTRSVRAVATILAAQLAQLVGDVASSEFRPPTEATVPPAGNFTPPRLRVNVRR